MPWKCYEVQEVELDTPVQHIRDFQSFWGVAYRKTDSDRLIVFPDLEVGAMWKSARGWTIKLPGDYYGVSWRTWQTMTGGGQWIVEHNTVEDLTITPSIHIIGTYHGWIRHSVVTDDVDGRQFNDLGGEITN